MPVAAIDVGDELPVGASEQAIEPHCLREGLLEVRGNGLQPRLGLADGQARRQRRLVLLLLVLLLAGLAPAPAALTGTGCPARRSAAGGRARALPTAAAQAWCIAALPTGTRDARAAQQVGLEARALDRLRLQAAQWSRLGGSVTVLRGRGLCVRDCSQISSSDLARCLADSWPEQTQKSSRLSAD